MFLRRTTRTHRGKTYTTYQLVESVRTSNGPRQKTICSLGDLGPRPREEWLKLAHKLADAVVGQKDLLNGDGAELENMVAKALARRHVRGSVAKPTVERPAARAGAGGAIVVDPHLITTERHREAGPVHVGYQFWVRLGLDEILQRHGLSLRLRRLACAMPRIKSGVEPADPTGFRACHAGLDAPHRRGRPSRRQLG